MARLLPFLNWLTFAVVFSVGATVRLEVSETEALLGDDGSLSPTPRKYDTECTQEAYEQYLKDYGKHSDSHDKERLERFCDEIRKINNFNNPVTLRLMSSEPRKVHFETGINFFTDLTEEEKDAYQGADIRFAKKIHTIYATANDNDTISDSLDWRAAGIVSDVKTQGHCGACWAFASVGAMESQLALHRKCHSKNVTLLSEQQLLDCTKDYGNYGCKGGWPSNAFKYLIEKAGISTGKDYPYKGTDGTCAFNRNESAGFVASVGTVTPGDEETLKHVLVTYGPVTAIIHGRLRTFKAYKKGIYDDPDCRQDMMTHAVLIIGYGHDEEYGMDYWLVKNSYSSRWGEDGYFRIARGINQCGIANWISYPILKF